MNDDHLAALARQPGGTDILLDMARSGEVGAKRAVDAICRERERRSLPRRLAAFFARIMDKAANL